MANQNPLRYRGYFQDNETGFYYCQSRYYDPSIGRFINVDSFASTGQGFLGYNMFAYCNNNPIMYSDKTGNVISSALVLGTIGIAVSGLLGGVFSAVNTISSGGTTAEAAVSFLIGGVAAATTAGVAMLDLTIGAVAMASFAIGATAELCSMATDACFDGQDYDYTDAGNIGQMLYAGCVNVISGTMSQGINKYVPGKSGIFTSSVASTGLGLCDFGTRKLVEAVRSCISTKSAANHAKIRKPSTGVSSKTSGGSMKRSFMYA